LANSSRARRNRRRQRGVPLLAPPGFGVAFDVAAGVDAGLGELRGELVDEIGIGGSLDVGLGVVLQKRVLNVGGVVDEVDPGLKRQGMSSKQACKLAGIAYRTGRKWRNRHRSLAAGRKAMPPPMSVASPSASQVPERG